MKRILFFSFFLTLFYGCEQNENMLAEAVTEEVFYPSKERFKADTDLEQTEIFLDSFSNYSALYKEMENLACEGKQAVIKFRHNNKIYYVSGNTSCPNSNIIGCFMRVNMLHINSDFIMYDYSDKKENSEKFDEVLSEIVANPNNYRFQSTSLRDAVIFFYVDPKHPIERTKELLIKVTSEFDVYNAPDPKKFPYYINFDDRPYSPIPPLPPPPPISPEECNF